MMPREMVVACLVAGLAAKGSRARPLQVVGGRGPVSLGVAARDQNVSGRDLYMLIELSQSSSMRFATIDTFNSAAKASTVSLSCCSLYCAVPSSCAALCTSSAGAHMMLYITSEIFMLNIMKTLASAANLLIAWPPQRVCVCPEHRQNLLVTDTLILCGVILALLNLPVRHGRGVGDISETPESMHTQDVPVLGCTDATSYCVPKQDT